MELSIRTLRDRVDPFLTELGTLLYRHGAGLTSALPLEALYRDYPELALPESFSLVKETLEKRNLSGDDQRKARSLLELLATQVEDRAAAEAVEEIARLESGGELAVENGAQPFREAVSHLAFEPQRGRRDLLEQAAGNFLFEHARPWARRREVALEVARTLGAPSYLALRNQVSGFEVEPLVAQCEAVLAKTEDPYRDLLGYALKKVEPDLRPLPGGNARRHDLSRIAMAPWLQAHFGPEDVHQAVVRCMEDLGFHPSAHGRIQLDTELRPGKVPRPFVADVKVPDDVRLVMRPGQGLKDAFFLLHEYGHALHFAHVARTLPVEERRLGDASVKEGWAFLFDHFLVDEGWHRRYLRLSQPVARDAARLCAFNNLVLLRRYAARLPYELLLYARGPSRELAEEYEARMTAALHVQSHKGFFLYDVDPQLYGARYLRAWALEVPLHRYLLESFDQDHYRNPAAGRWLRAQFEAGQREDAAQKAAALGGTLDLVAAGDRLVEVLGR